MKRNLLKSSIFILSIICFLITCKLHYNMGIYVDEFNTTPDAVVGGNFWLAMDWLRFGVSGLLCILSGLSVFSNKK